MRLVFRGVGGQIQPTKERERERRMSFRILLLLFVYSLIIVQFVHSLIIVQSHDWDLDAFLYLSSRLENRELIYFRDFDTKLPLLQYIFWFPHHFGGIGLWRSITFIISMFLIVNSTHVIVTTLIDDRVALQKSSRKIVLLSSSVPLLFLYSLPGSSSAQISMFAAVFMYQAIALWHRALQRKYSENLYIVLSAAATAIAVSIRPNYLFTIPAFAMFSIIPAIASTEIHKYIYVTKQLAIFGIALSFFILIQFVPYFFYVNGPSVLLSALLEMRHFSSGLSSTGLLKRQFIDQSVVALFYLCIYASLGFMLFISLHRKDHGNSYLIRLSGILTCGIAIAGLDYSFLTIHFWGHYSIMFVPYAAVLITYLCILLFERESIPVKVGFVSLNKEGAFLSIILLVGLYLCNATEVLQKSNDLMFKTEKKGLAINDRNFNPNLMELLKQMIDRGISFYVPSNVNYHRLLNHERIGDGNPQMLYSVLGGQRVGPVDNIFLYSDKVHWSPCIALWESRKDLIVIYTASRVDIRTIRCLTGQDSNYEELLLDNREISRSLGALFKKFRHYRFFVYKTRLGEILSLLNQDEGSRIER
jgi:hypothetical protein